MAKIRVEWATARADLKILRDVVGAQELTDPSAGTAFTAAPVGCEVACLVAIGEGRFYVTKTAAGAAAPANPSASTASFMVSEKRGRVDVFVVPGDVLTVTEAA